MTAPARRPHVCVLEYHLLEHVWTCACGNTIAGEYMPVVAQ